jgi:hypothetical protein
MQEGNLQRRRDEAEARVDSCERSLSVQHQLIRDLEKDGHRITEAVAVLERIEAALKDYTAERDRLRTMLEARQSDQKPVVSRPP